MAIGLVLVALLHVYIMILEVFLWRKAAGRRAFGLSQEFADSTQMLATNQGVYNGFLAAGLFWSLWLGLAGEGGKVAVFFSGAPAGFMKLSRT